MTYHRLWVSSVLLVADEDFSRQIRRSLHELSQFHSRRVRRWEMAKAEESGYYGMLELLSRENVTKSLVRW